MEGKVEEKIFEVSHEHADLSCAECGKALAPGVKALQCPRCRTPHHLDCWIGHGGCARRGCRQRVSPELLPPKAETPIRASKAPAWVFVAAAALVVAVGAGLWINARNAAAERMRTVSVMLPASVDQAYWKELADEYGELLKAEGKSVLLTFVPEIVPVMEGQTIEAGYYDQKLLIQMAANDAPELVLLPARRVSLYISQGALTPVDELAAELASLIDPALLSPVTFEGSVYALPHPGADAYLAIPKAAKHPDEAKELLAFVVARLARRAGTPAG